MIHVRTYVDLASFLADPVRPEPLVEATEGLIRSQSRVDGYCPLCETIQSLQVDVGPNFGAGYPNLREGLLCECGAKNRDRLMGMASRQRLRAAERTIFFGALSGWANWARRLVPQSLVFCEFLGDAHALGATVEVNAIPVQNQDLTRMTFEDGSADLILHQDILEHIPDYRGALAETFRVLKPGGATIFTAPFFHEMPETFVRAAVRPDGTIEHFAPEERHGDPLVPEGILAFYNFGWTLLDDMRAAGFADAAMHLVYSPDLGLVSTGCPVSPFNMLPLYLTGSKPS